MTTVVFTAVFGKTDALRTPIAIDPTARYVCFADRPVCVEPYEWIYVPATETPRIASRRIKVLADHPILLEADATLYHDASYQLLQGPAWVSETLDREPCDLVAMKHPKRRTSEKEGRKIAKYGYLTRGEAKAHVERYRASGYPKEIILAGGLLGRRVSPEMSAFNAAWWREVQVWNGRDQPSLSFCAWQHNLRVFRMAGTIRNNAYAAWRDSAEEAASR